MPRNVHIKTVKEQYIVERDNVSSDSKDHSEEKFYTLTKEVSVFKGGKKSIKDNWLIKKFSAFSKKFKNTAFAEKLAELNKRFKRFAYKDYSTEIDKARIRSSSFIFKIWQYLKHGIKIISLTIFAILKAVFPVAVPLLGVGIIVFSVWWLLNHSIVLEIRSSANDVLGYVDSYEDYKYINSKLSDSIVQRTGEEYVQSSFSSYSLTVVNNDSVQNSKSSDDIYSSLLTDADQHIGRYYGLFIDGKLVGATRSEAIIEKVKFDVLAYYSINEDNTTYSILNDFETVRDTYAKTYILSYEELFGLFSEPVEPEEYIVKKNDTLKSIAKQFDMSVPMLKLVNKNPNLTVSTGDHIRIGKPSLSIQVQTSKVVSYNDIIPYDTQYIDSYNYFEGTTFVRNSGSNGYYEITAQINSIDGEEISRTILSKIKVKDAVSRQILVGKKEIVPSGKFIFPLDRSGYYRITSYFGWRTLRGVPGFHRGLDLAANNGTKIYAVDAGVVSEIGYSASGLGNYIKIDHGNGITTVYGHASRISSEMYEGKKVYQGQVIAYVGSTGNSTGNHLHLAVYNNATKEYMDPLPYIKKLL